MPRRCAGIFDRCPWRARSRWRSDALADAETDSGVDAQRRGQRRHAAEIERVSRSAAGRCAARTNFPRRYGCAVARSLLGAYPTRHRGDGGMKLDDIRAAEAKLLVKTYERTPICFVGGEGVHLFDEDGNAYLDLLSGIGVSALGYAHPAIQSAIDEQSRKLMHVSNLFFHSGQVELALRLTEMTGLDRAFFCNSGTEAWETALKLARAYATLCRSEGHP